MWNVASGLTLFKFELTAVFLTPNILENGQTLENATKRLAESSSSGTGRCAFDGME